MGLTLPVILVAMVILPDIASGAVCTTTSYVTTYSSSRYTTSCGWWGWSRCTRYRSQSHSNAVDVHECCSGDYGHVSSGCSGECPYDTAQMSTRCNGRTCRDYVCDNSGSHSSYSSFTVHENDNSARKLFTANSTCFVQFTCPDCSCNCNRKKRSVATAVDREKRAACLCSRNEPCTQCSVSNTRLFEVRNGVDIWRRACRSQCSDCRTEVGCFNADSSYSNVAVTCTGSGNDVDDSITTTFALNVQAAQNPVVTFPDTNNGAVTLSGGSSVGDVILSVDLNLGTSPGSVTYSLSGVRSPYSNTDLFVYDETDGEVKVAADLSTEPSHVYNVTLCVNTRRSSVCKRVIVDLETITTTTAATTTTTEPPRFCKAIGAWNVSRAMDWWCEMVCNHPDPYCPETHCYCSWLPFPERKVCHPAPTWSEVSGMDMWCDWNCNTDYPVACTPDFCICDPEVNWNITAPWQRP